MIISRNKQRFWVPRMSDKGIEVYLNHRRITLLHGPRRSTKSNTIQNMVINHCWLNNGAVFGVVVKGLKLSVNGVWDDIVGPYGILEDQWFKELDGCEYAVRPSFVRDTKMRYFRIWNKHGGQSEVQLHTLETDRAVEKFKDSRFSGFYLVEADRWDSEDVLNKLSDQLRIWHIPDHKHEIFLDCNPPRTGRKSWLYQKFLRDRDGNYPPDIKPHLMEVAFTLEDNQFIPQSVKDSIRENNSHDEIELARNYRGEWVASREGTAFKDQFRAEHHVIGDLAPSDPRMRSALMPPEGCSEFPTGWDMGDAMNHAAVIGCKVMVEDGTQQIYVIDEHVRTGVNYSAGRFGREFASKMDFWENHMEGKNTPYLRWRHWSDSSSLNYSSAADSSVAREIRLGTDGRILLKGIKKGAGSVFKRQELLKRMLNNNRLFISARCTCIIQMLEQIETDSDGDIDPKDPLKHIFDALTYMLMYEIGIFSIPLTPQATTITRIA